MISILVKNTTTNQVVYNTTSFDEKLESFIKGNTREYDAIKKKLAKEFDIKVDEIHSYNILN